ncbi:protein ROOT INITIATION DEFECTIVE 3 isoform X1 [Iris pallida]|uniref:Protein ROOT INITIATION DEFECTIVE 3 isoform X1 n=1 Tax=Iris pallida TaxID=29817 RepID=A0AAX6GDM1_IRIPA|nr:protein ROOT INITIATION DEFECTIVE 3 isoform X1 [Iris pallida]
MEEVVMASSSSLDSGIGSWELRSGSERTRYRSSATPPRSLLSLPRRNLLLSSSSSNNNNQILFWSLDRPQVEVRSFPAEPIGPLVSDSDGAYVIGGGASGSIYLWEVASGKLLNKWHAHYRSLSCLTLSNDESLLISGSEDGCVRVWSLMMMFDDIGKEAARNLYRYNFSEHTLRVTDVASGHGLCNSIVVSSSEDRTCKVWSLSEGRSLRTITFPCIIDAIAIDPGEHAFYAGGRDGKIYIAALSAECNPNSSYGEFIIGSLSDQSKAVTCLTFSTDGVTLLSGSEDGLVRVWDTKSQHVIRLLKHGKGPVNNVIIVRQPIRSTQVLANTPVPISRKRMHLAIPPPLEKYVNSTDGEVGNKAVTMFQSPWDDLWDKKYCSSYVMSNQIRDHQQSGSSGGAEMELERLRQECKRSAKMVQQWKKLYNDLQNVCANEFLGEVQLGES